MKKLLIAFLLVSFSAWAGTPPPTATAPITIDSNMVIGCATCITSGTATAIAVGTTAVTGGTTAKVLYDNAGVVGEYTITGTGNVVMSASPTLSGTITGGTFSGTHTGGGSGLTGIGTASLGGITGTPSATTFVRGDGTWGTPAGTGVSTFSAGTTGFTPNSATAGAITLAGTLAVANGGTGASSASITAFNNITGFSAAGTTGTTSTNLVFSTSPTIASPTFSGTVAGSNTIPLSILAQSATNTVLGNSTSGTANVTALSVGGCSSSSSALIWTTNTGFGCNTAIVASSSTTSTTATNATNTAITEDTTTNASMFPTWVTANTGNLPQKTTSTKLTFNPSTGVLSSTSFTGAGTGLTGTGASFTAGNVTTNANLTGVITSSGNATSIASQTGTGTKFVVDTSPALITPSADSLNLTGATPPANGIYNCGSNIVCLSSNSTKVLSFNTNGLHIQGVGVTIDAGKTGAGVEDVATGGAAGNRSGFDFDFNDGTTANIPGAALWPIKENSTVGNSNSALAFGTRLSGTGIVENMFIDSGGLVGIGTTTSTYGYALDVQKSLASQNVMNIVNLSSSGFSVIDFRNNSRTYEGYIGWGNSGAAFANQFVIGTATTNDIIFYPNNSSTVFVKSGGGIGIGTSTLRNSALLDVQGGINSNSANIFFTALATGTNADTVCLSSAGKVLIQAAACTISKRELKENFGELYYNKTISDIMALHPVEFNFKKTNPANKDPNAMTTQYGFIADEVAGVDQKLALFDDDMKTPKSYRQEALIALLVKTVQIQQGQIKDAHTAHRCVSWLPLSCVE